MKYSGHPGTVLEAFISLFTAISLTFHAAPAAAALPLSAPAAVQAGGEFPLPASLGEISDVYTNPANRGLVIILRDAHAVTEAQEKIRDIIDYLRSVYGVKTFLLEGARGRLDAALLKTFPDPVILDQVLAGYLRRGELTGAEMAAIYDDGGALYQGMERWDVYEAHYAAFLEADHNRAEAEKSISRFKDALRRKAETVLPAEFLESWRLFAAYDDDGSSLPALADFAGRLLSLDHASPETSGRFPSLTALYRSMRKNTSSDGNGRQAVRSIAEAFRKEALARLSEEEQRNFNARYQSYLIGEITAGEFLDSFAAAAEKKGIPADIPPDLADEREAAKNLSAIRGTRLYGEIRAFMLEYEKRIPAEGGQRKCFERLRELALLRDLAELELSREDLESLERSGIQDKGVREILEPARKFYRHAAERDKVFAGRLDEELKRTGPIPLAVVAGGFHSEAIARHLRDKGRSYIVITPAVRNTQGSGNYGALMRGRFSYSESVGMTLHEKLMRDASRRLLSQIPDGRRNEILIRWKDRLLALLSAQNRPHDFSHFLRYIGLPPEAPAEPSAGFEADPIHLRKALNEFSSETIGALWSDFLRRSALGKQMPRAEEQVRNVSSAESGLVPRLALDPGLPAPRSLEPAAEFRSIGAAGDTASREEDARSELKGGPQKIELLVLRYSELPEDEKERLNPVLASWGYHPDSGWNGKDRDAMVAYGRTSKDGRLWDERIPAGVQFFTFHHADPDGRPAVWTEGLTVSPAWSRLGAEIRGRLQDRMLAALKAKKEAAGVFVVSEPTQEDRRFHEQSLVRYGDAVYGQESHGTGEIDQYFVDLARVDRKKLLPGSLVLTYSPATRRYTGETRKLPPLILLFQSPLRLWNSIVEQLGFSKIFDNGEGCKVYRSFLYPDYYFKKREARDLYRLVAPVNPPEVYDVVSRKLDGLGLGLEEIPLQISLKGEEPRPTNIRAQRRGVLITNYLAARPEESADMAEREYRFVRNIWRAGYFDSDFKRPNHVLIWNDRGEMEIRLIDFDFVYALPEGPEAIRRFLLTRTRNGDDILRLSPAEHFLVRLFYYKDDEDPKKKDVLDASLVRERLFPGQELEPVRLIFKEARDKAQAIGDAAGGVSDKKAVFETVTAAYAAVLDSHPEIAALAGQLAGKVAEEATRSEARSDERLALEEKLFLGSQRGSSASDPAGAWARTAGLRRRALRDHLRAILTDELDRGLRIAAAGKISGGELGSRFSRQNLEPRLGLLGEVMDYRTLQNIMAGRPSEVSDSSILPVSARRREPVTSSQKFLLVPRNRDVLRSAYREFFGTDLPELEPGSVFMDALFLRNTQLQRIRSLAEGLRKKGLFIIAYRKGTERDSNLGQVLKIPGIVRRTYSGENPLDLRSAAWKDEDVLYLLPEGIPLLEGRAAPGHAAFIAADFYYSSGLDAVELLTLVELVRERFGGGPFTKEQLQQGLSIVNQLLSTRAAQEAMARAA